MPNTIINPHQLGLHSMACYKAGHCINEPKLEWTYEDREQSAIGRIAQSIADKIDNEIMAEYQNER